MKILLDTHVLIWAVEKPEELGKNSKSLLEDGENEIFISPVSTLEIVALGLINMSIASFMTMNFTGSSTYTSLSGVKKEMKFSVPFQIGFAVFGIILQIVGKLINV